MEPSPLPRFLLRRRPGRLVLLASGWLLIAISPLGTAVRAHPPDDNLSDTIYAGRGGGRSLIRPVLRARAAVTRRGATERGTSGVEHPRLRGLTGARGSGRPHLDAAPGPPQKLRVFRTQRSSGIRPRFHCV